MKLKQLIKMLTEYEDQDAEVLLWSAEKGGGTLEVLSSKSSALVITSEPDFEEDAVYWKLTLED